MERSEKMKRDSSLRPGRWVDNVEEETKVRKNLSRLIHTVQHMPSDRYRRDASTLWNLVDELESFQSPDPLTSFNYSKKTARKSFSRKYLDLRLYPSRDRSISPESNLKNQKHENKPLTFKNNSCKTSKKPDVNKKYTDQNMEPNTITSQDKRSFNKTKPDRSKNCKDNVLLEKEKDKTSSEEREMVSEFKGSQLKPRVKLNRFQIRRKTEGTTTHKQSYYSERSKYKIVDKNKEIKQDNLLKDKPNASNQFKRTINKELSRENPLEKEQASMVKKLTSYWNNLLSKEVDDNDFSSSQGSSDDPMMNKSLHDLARRIYRKGKDLQRRGGLSRRRSESSMDILKNIDGFKASSDALNDQNENEDKFIECLSVILSKSDVSSTISYKKGLRLNKESLNNKIAIPSDPCSLEMYFDQSCGDNLKLPEDRKSKLQDNCKPDFDLKVRQAVEVMDKLVRKLKRFSELPLTCDQISLPHSLRTMLCLMTATVLSYEEQLFDDYLEIEVEEEIPGDECNSSKADLRHSSGYAELRDSPLTESLNCSTNVRNCNLQLVAVEGITMRKVEDALRYLTLCKDYLWTEFLLSSRCNGEGLYSNRHLPQSFTFVIEEEILFREDSDEDQCYFENESEHEEEDERTTEEVYKSAIDFISISLERLTELTADLIINYWPDSVHDFVRILYQTLVSLLVWWVIMKELFFK